ncbi:hypothetical protein PGN35_002630 [Nodosilinea sp. PGN35]|uniref:hypothetical protein n=1 Tax=Nodosilinea sp. PGN35 TaxID=3020489 RepID=UPI0023B2E66D|nr:hypothetical protein [Nodosilinea sp. TSF1-S3]MDF0365515.1 hypothetical protein [Nodosilinea sp. TSF1-S3]
MATSSRSFQSQTVGRLVAGYRQVAHSAGQWLRQGRTAAVWGLQVAVYPLYAAVQGWRLGSRRLQAARPWQRVWARLTGGRSPELVAADTPIRALLSVLQPPVLHSQTARPGGLQLVNVYGRWLKQSQAGAVLTPGQWHLVPLNAPLRGIASDLATQRLVLVTADNSIFAGLTADQHQRLEQALVLMLAEYARVRRRWSLDSQLQQPGLPLPQAHPAVVPPLRWLPAALRWLQTSPLAAATNLFGEASQQGRTTTVAKPGLWPIAPRRPAAPIGHPGTSNSEARTLPAAAKFALHRPQPYGQLAFPHGFGPGLSAPTAQAEPVAAGAMVVVDTGSTAVALAADPGGLAVGHQGAGAIALDRQATVETASTFTDSLGAAPLAGADCHQLTSPAALEVKVTQVNYVDHPLVAVLRGLDWLLYGFETWLRTAWAWLRSIW